MSKLTIDLTTEDIKSLIPDDEVQLVIKEWATNEFAQRYLKPLMHTTEVQAIIRAATQAMNEQVIIAVNEKLGEVKRSYSGIPTGITLHRVIKEEITRIVEQQVNTTFREMFIATIQDKINSAKERYEQDIDRAIKVALNRNIEQQVAEEVERRLQAIKDNL